MNKIIVCLRERFKKFLKNVEIRVYSNAWKIYKCRPQYSYKKTYIQEYMPAKQHTYDNTEDIYYSSRPYILKINFFIDS